MELVTSLFAVAAGTAESAGAGLMGLVPSFGGTAAAGASAASAATTTGLGLQGLQGTLTAGSMLASAGQGIMSLIQGNQNATQAEIQAKQQALNIQRDYLVKTGAARVAFAGSGVQIGSGSEAATENSLGEQASLQERLATASGNAAAQAATLSGVSGAIGAGAGILKTGAQYELSIASRGLPS